jgi:predicted GIY-YIG superfamily endonuclease
LRGKGPVHLAYAKAYSYYKNALHAERNIKRLLRKQKDELVKIYAQRGVQPKSPTQFC